MLFLSVRGFLDYAGPTVHSRLAWLPCCLPPTRNEVGILIYGFSQLNSPAHRCLCLRFKRHLAVSPARLEVRMDSLLPFLSNRASGPRKLMKITPSRMQNRTGSERQDRPYS